MVSTPILKNNSRNPRDNLKVSFDVQDQSDIDMVARSDSNYFARSLEFPSEIELPQEITVMSPEKEVTALSPEIEVKTEVQDDRYLNQNLLAFLSDGKIRARVPPQDTSDGKILINNGYSISKHTKHH